MLSVVGSLFDSADACLYNSTSNSTSTSSCQGGTGSGQQCTDYVLTDRGWQLVRLQESVMRQAALKPRKGFAATKLRRASVTVKPIGASASLTPCCTPAAPGAKPSKA